MRTMRVENRPTRDSSDGELNVKPAAESNTAHMMYAENQICREEIQQKEQSRKG